ncbi:TPA: translation initiation factor IF-3 [Candidatus Galligastranaerophilus intestinavium]|uniref:Translation initiation factor IF-3 n=1 Tax=Candidatus Galligastranaerophilus intestinavium TaxID=2840836 RepID=A0A9D1FKA9_9BACT|nr:translation initiation factor IF-3 [Candidatus Galligastranaerophilus intestinavium]
MNKEIKAQKELVNEKIRAREVRLIDADGTNCGLVAINKALEMAREKDLDLVVVSPNQSPPVAKIMDWGKYKYETEKRAKEARKKQHTIDIKEVKMRYKIDTHDYEVRLKSAKKFILSGNKVKVVVMLRGREMQHSKLALDLANKFLSEFEEGTFTLEKAPSLEGRNVVAVLAPAGK